MVEGYLDYVVRVNIPGRNKKILDSRPSVRQNIFLYKGDLELGKFQHRWELKEFEKAAHGSSWPFGPSVVILEKPAPRR